MDETIIVRNNHLIDPALSIWGWEIPAYLFLGGVAAGIMILTSLFRPDTKSVSRWIRYLPFAAPVLISIGMFFLFLDLEFKLHVYRFYLFFNPSSPMSWGSWILIFIYPATILLGAAGLTDEELSKCRVNRATKLGNRIRDWALKHTTLLRWINLVLGIGLGIYTGILLGSLGARPLWNSSILGPLFLVSGISTGAAFMMLFPVNHDEHVLIRKWDMMAIAAELSLIILFLVGLSTSGAASNAAVAMFLGGRFTAVFWSLVVIVGLVIPLGMKLTEIKRDSRPSIYAPVFILTGGLALRFILVTAGQVTV